MKPVKHLEEKFKTGAIYAFSGTFGFLSNFYPVVVRMDSMEFFSVENAYQAAKAPRHLRGPFIGCRPGEAKAMGKRVSPLPPDWETRKLEVMAELLAQKFSAPELRNKLLATQERLLVEGNTWGDTFWGVNVKTLEGTNHLGRLLMELRTKIRQEAP